MTITQKVHEDYLSSLKSGNKSESDILRIVMSNLKNAKVAKGNVDDLTEDEELKVLFSEYKKLKEEVELFEKGGRQDLADNSKKQLPFVERYLPKQAGASDIEKIVDEVVKETGASSVRDMGKVMGLVMKKLQGKADGSIVNALVKKKLSEGE